MPQALAAVSDLARMLRPPSCRAVSCGVARALSDPAIVIADEPTAGLDANATTASSPSATPLTSNVLVVSRAEAQRWTTATSWRTAICLEQ